LQTWAEFEDFMSAARTADVVRGIKDIHWDIRPHPDFGTLEIRAMDSATDLPTLHGLVAFARSMVLCLRDAPVEDVDAILPPNLPRWIAQENRFRASHFGLDAEYIVDAKGKLHPLRDLIADLIEFCGPTAASAGEAAGLALAKKLLTGVSGYERQRQAYEESHSIQEVVNMLSGALRSSLIEETATKRQSVNI
jgi:carboxylate-amine ligase